MPTYQVCPPASAAGTKHVKVRAAYGMQITRATIAPSDQRYKPTQINPAPWVYRQGKAGQGIVKINRT
jgi:hypothetical protein